MSIFSLAWLFIVLSVCCCSSLHAELSDSHINTLTLPFSSANDDEARHFDVLVVNPDLHIAEVLEKTLVRSPMRSAIASKEVLLTSKKTLAHAMLPAAPAMVFSHQNDSLASDRGEREWQAELDLPVWMPSQRNKRLKVVDATSSSLNASRDSLKLHVAGLLREVLWEIAMTENDMALAGNKRLVANKLQQDVEKRFLAGEVAKTDLMLTQQEALRAEQERLRTEAEVMHVRHRYYLLTGLREIPESYTEQQSLLSDYKQSPIWLEAQSKTDLAQTELALAQIEGRENMQLSLSMRSIRGGFDTLFNQSVGVKLRIPFGSDVRAAPIKAAAEQNVGNALTEQAQLQYNLETAMHEAEHSLELSRAELILASQQHEIASASARLADKAFKLGEADLVSLVRVQARAFESERIFTSQKIRVQWDVARYNQTVGVLP